MSKLIKNLIVNADDYGRTAEVSRGIRTAHINGIVTSTTCLMNMPTIVADIALALQETPLLGLGVHLVLTAGKPLSPAENFPSLVDAQGKFHLLAPFTEGIREIDPAEAKMEWQAQIEAFIAAAGKTPDHLDSHHHCSYFTEGLFAAMLELASEYDCAIRNPVGHPQGGGLDGLPPELHAEVLEFWPRLLAKSGVRTTDTFFANFYDTGATQDDLLHILQLLEGGSAEIMCHPGYTDLELLENSGYSRPRARELEILTSDGIHQAIQVNGINLISFAEL